MSTPPPPPGVFRGPLISPSTTAFGPLSPPYPLDSSFLRTDACTRCSIQVNGAYSAWSQWSACSKTCGKGTRTRERSCSNPVPRNGGRDCSELGPRSQSQECEVEACAVGSYGKRQSIYFSVVTPHMILLIITMCNGRSPQEAELAIMDPVY